MEYTNLTGFYESLFVVAAYVIIGVESIQPDQFVIYLGADQCIIVQYGLKDISFY